MSKKYLNLYQLTFMVSLFTFVGKSLEASIVRISDENQYNNQVAQNKSRVLVQFSADWCSVCNGIQKSLEEIASEPEFEDITFAQVNVDKLDGVSKQNGIVGVPTFVYMENGSKKVEEIGVQHMPTFKNHLRENLRKTFQVAANDATTQITDKADGSTAHALAEKGIPSDPVSTEQTSSAIMAILNPIRDFIMLIINKIQAFFTTIFDAIKGFFN